MSESKTHIRYIRIFQPFIINVDDAHPLPHIELLSKVGDGDFRRRVRLAFLRP